MSQSSLCLVVHFVIMQRKKQSVEVSNIVDISFSFIEHDNTARVICCHWLPTLLT